MTNDFTPIDNPDSESSMFAPIPTWERGKKRRSFGSRGERAAPEPRSFAPLEKPSTTLSGDARAYEARMDTVDPTDTSFAAAPVYADRTARKGNGAAPIAIAAGVILLGGLAAAGWYAYQPHNAGVAELTPGQTTPDSTTTTTQVASTVPAASDQQVAQNTAPAAPAAAAKVTTTTTTHSKAPVRTTVTRTASRSASATDRAADASTTAPVQAAPTPAPNPAAPAAAAPPAPLKLDIPPAQAAPTATAPATLTQAPTQTAPAPAPTQTPPS